MKKKNKLAVNYESKEVSKFVQFGANTIKYSFLTSKFDVKMDSAIIYSFQSYKF
ncbi:hypothetical protein C2G38_2219856 [Gigaspora rosea]|uniref:Uncharacterized protein n=1 Tax=Gigaspora rosea TaxID=44941 RepID=A0A397U4X8_9GLOM|nr:hypothetical protein C2G38_2219856 [Gigaspora rosea]